MIITFLGDDYNRSLADFYLINIYGFERFDPRENILEGIKKIFKLTDLQIYGEGFYEDRIDIFDRQSPQDMFNEIESCILHLYPDYYEIVVSKYLEETDGNVLLTGLSCGTDMFDRDNFFVIGLNCGGDFWVDFGSEEELFTWLDEFLKGKGVEKL